MSKQVTFYANRADLISSLVTISSKLSVRYTDAWIHDTLDIPYFDDLTEWDDLGVNKTGKSVGAGFFLITKKDEAVSPKTINMNDGSTKYKVEPLLNPHSIIIQPSGVFSDEDGTDYLMSGKFGTAMDNSESLDLFKEFKKLFLKGYKNVNKQYYIGPESSEEEASGRLQVW